MLYKVTPAMPSATEQGRQEREPGQARKRRKSAVYDADGHEVLITLMCLKCRSMKPLGQFGLRKMADGAIRNQPWCRTCRGAAGTKKVPAAEPEPIAQRAQIASAAEAAPSAESGSTSIELGELSALVVP